MVQLKATARMSSLYTVHECLILESGCLRHLYADVSDTVQNMDPQAVKDGKCSYSCRIRNVAPTARARNGIFRPQCMHYLS